MKSRLHASTRIRVPVEPLYTQPLGQATLRAAIVLVPETAPSGVQFKSSFPIYPSYLPIGPRSPQQFKMRRSATVPYTLQDALEISTINTNLLTLLPNEWRLNTTQPKIREDL